MTQLTVVPQGVEKGRYNIHMKMTTGDAKIQYNLGDNNDDGGADSTFIDIPSSLQTGSTGFNVDLPSCKIKAITTGDAIVNFLIVER